MARILFAHGDKGGVGKSLVAAAAVDYCIANHRPVGLIEGDKTQPDVALRYNGLIDIEAVNLQRSDNRQKAGRQLVDEAVQKLAANTGDSHIVVVNLPASASNTLDNIAESIVAAASIYGHTCSVVYCLGPLRPATDGIRASAQSGLIHAIKPNITVAYNEYLGNPKHWDYFTSGARDEIGTRFHEIRIPALDEELANKVFSTRRPFSELVRTDCDDLMVMEKMLFRQHWLDDMQEAIASLLPADRTEKSEEATDNG